MVEFTQAKQARAKRRLLEYWKERVQAESGDVQAAVRDALKPHVQDLGLTLASFKLSKPVSTPSAAAAPVAVPQPPPGRPGSPRREERKGRRNKRNLAAAADGVRVAVQAVPKAPRVITLDD
jgi:hypothetical protein